MSLESEFNETTTVISAFGSGDAFAGDKVERDKISIATQVIQQNVSLNSVKPILDKVVESLSKNDRNEAKTLLDVASMMGDLSTEAKNSILALKVVLGFSVTPEDKMEIQKVSQRFSTNQPYDAYQDIVNAAAIILLRELKSASEVERIYKQLPAGMFTEFSYFYSLTEVTSLDELPLDVDSANVIVLRILLDKFLEFNNLEGSKKLLDIIKSKDHFSDFSSYEIVIDCIGLNEFISCDYFLLKTKDKAILDDTCKRLISHCQSLDKPDHRMLSITAQIAIYTQCDNTILMEYLKEHTHLLVSMKFSGIEELLNCLSSDKAMTYHLKLKEMTSEELQLRIIRSVKGGLFIGSTLAKVFCDRKDSNLIIQTLDKIYELKQTPNTLCNYCLLVAFASEHIADDQFPLLKVEDVLSEKISNINYPSMLIFQIAMQFDKCGRKELALISLNLIFSANQPWLSDLYIKYLSLLYENEQYYDLRTRLESLDSFESKKPDIINLQANVATNDTDYDLAIKLLKGELAKYENKPLSSFEKEQCICLWLNLINNINFFDSSEIASTVERIPISLFVDPDNPQSWSLLSFFSQRFSEIEELLLRWFFLNPNKYAKNFHSVIFNITQTLGDSFSPGTSCSFDCGYVYTEQKNTKIKVLSSEELSIEHPEYLINKNGKLAELLSSKSKGKSFLNKAKICIVKEELSAIICAYRIAMNLLDNNENEVFHMIPIPEDFTFESLMKTLDEVTGRKDGYDESIEKILKGNIPINLKYSCVNYHNDFGKAVKSILSEHVYFDIFNSMESKLDDFSVNCDDVVLDEIAFAFLAITGLWQQLDKSCFHITIETELSVKSWITTYGNKGISFSKDSDDFVPIHESNVDNCINLRSSIELLLANCKIHYTRDYNVPLKLSLCMGKLLTTSTKSSLGLASKNKWGYFTPDATMRHFLKMKEFSCINLAVCDFMEFVYENTSSDVVDRVLKLSDHNFNLTVPWLTIFQFCISEEEYLETLSRFIQKMTVDAETIKKLGLCFSILMKRNVLKKIKDVEFNGFDFILEILFIKFLEFDHRMASNFILDFKPDSIIGFYSPEVYITSEALYSATEDYIVLVNKCLSSLGISKDCVWAEVGDL